MIILISPAKSLDFDTSVEIAEATQPRFAEKTEKLANALSRFSKPKLKAIMPVSDSLIALNHGRYKDFFAQPEKQALFAYNGDVYTGLEAKTMDEAAIDFAQDHLRILSGLYGLLRPLDQIRPHRLEMGTRWAPRRKKLVDYWQDDIAPLIAKDAEDIGAKVIINLASQEYFAAVEAGKKALALPIINIDFRQDGPDGPRFISFAAKRARGTMARYICENRLTDPEALKDFDWDGYSYDPDSSDDTNLRFIRS
ncbi:MAG: peroxide stress protein YaaA [Pseudomonadota bacterium]